MGCQIKTIKQSVDYIADPLHIYQEICAKKPHNLLLESADIESKDQLKSMVLLESAVTFECLDEYVYISALCDDGIEVIQHLYEHCAQRFKCNFKTNRQLVIKLHTIAKNLNEDARLKADSAFSILRTIIQTIPIDAQNSHPFSLFLAGGFAFDMINQTEKISAYKSSHNSFPDYLFYLAKSMLLIDHVAQTTEILYNNFDGSTPQNDALNPYIHNINQAKKSPKTTLTTMKKASAEDYQVNMNDEAYAQSTRQLQQHIIDGDIFQIVPSRCFSINCQQSFLAYDYLKQSNPSPYMFFMQCDGFQVFGASPESSLKYDAHTRQVELYPIAGTRPRGATVDLDSRIELDLKSDSKEISEHLMLVDLARNDIARISKAGTRHVKEFLKVDRYSHVMHLVSKVVGELREDLDALHAYQACMNMGTLTGAPKPMATKIIYATEGTRRGSYGGAIGYFLGDGSMDSCIVIRSAFIRDNKAYIQAGAGIVYDSQPMMEAMETTHKAKAVLNAVHSSNLHIKEEK